MTGHYDALETRKHAEREAESGNAPGKISNCFRLSIACTKLYYLRILPYLTREGDSPHPRLGWPTNLENKLRVIPVPNRGSCDFAGATTLRPLRT
jgi:hypothetical protein